MPVEVIMPKVDMDMATGKLAAWHAAEGEIVTKGAPLFDIETDKAAMEVESPATGRLHHVIAAPGPDHRRRRPGGLDLCRGRGGRGGPGGRPRPAAEPSPPRAGAGRRDPRPPSRRRRGHGRGPGDADRAAAGAGRPGSSSAPSPGPARAAASSARTSRGCCRRPRSGAGEARGPAPGRGAPSRRCRLGRGGGRPLRLDPQGHRDAAPADPRLRRRLRPAGCRWSASCRADVPLIRIDLPSHGKSPRRRIARLRRAGAGGNRGLRPGGDRRGAPAGALARRRRRARARRPPAAQHRVADADRARGARPGDRPCGADRHRAGEPGGEPRALAEAADRDARTGSAGTSPSAAMLARNDPELRAAQLDLAEALFPDGVQGFDVTAALERVTAPTAIDLGPQRPHHPLAPRACGAGRDGTSSFARNWAYPACGMPGHRCRDSGAQHEAGGPAVAAGKADQVCRPATRPAERVRA